MSAVPACPAHSRASCDVPNPRLVLASLSSRRSEILSRLGIRFDVEPADVDESVRPGEAASDYVLRVAADKATAVRRSDTITIAADTSVVLRGEILGKPTGPEDAAEMLARLSGTVHQVMTGVVVALAAARGPIRIASASETTTVHFAAIPPARIRWYASLAEPLDKAGAYGMQGAGSLFADHIDGSVTNVIGLPIQMVDKLFGDLGFDLLSFAPRGGANLPS